MAADKKGGDNEQGGKKEVGSEGKREHRGEIVAQTRSWMNTMRLCRRAVYAERGCAFRAFTVAPRPGLVGIWRRVCTRLPLAHKPNPYPGLD